jgi:hypothetical protein
MYGHARFIPPKSTPKAMSWGNLRGWLGQGADERLLARWLSKVGASFHG